MMRSKATESSSQLPQITDQMTQPTIVKIDDIKELLVKARADPKPFFSKIYALAASGNWQTREVAATALVEIGKRHADAVLQLCKIWAKDKDNNVRRTASEGLRGIVKLDPEGVRPIIESLCADSDLYVKKSVANVLRNASGKHAEFVLTLCRQWARSKDKHTQWIVKDGLRKLSVSHPREVDAILASIEAP
jgi:3-methyladenine DNA glycosylase AlkC